MAAEAIPAGARESEEAAPAFGEAPPAPTLEQLSERTAVVTGFSGLPSALAGMATSRVPAGAV